MTAFSETKDEGPSALARDRPLLAVRDLRSELLKPASFDLRAGESIAVRGPSGGGKTLLLRALADLDPNDGKVDLEGRDRTTMSGPGWRRQVGYLPAEPGWWRTGFLRILPIGRRRFQSSGSWDFRSIRGLADRASLERGAVAARFGPRADGGTESAVAR